MHIATSPAFKENAHHALEDAGLQKALARSGPSFIARRTAAVAGLPEFEQLRDIARDIKNHTLANLDFYLETWAENVEKSGGKVHWCATADEARDAVLTICQAANARTVTKGKSMISEELGINDHLERHGITPVETDLGEYIIQLRHELPSHIIAPAFHLNLEDWEDSFRKSHTDLPADRVFHERRDILTEARTKLRQKFLAADVGITGANFLIAETGSSVIVTNEGNGDLTQTLPRVHIVLASIEKMVPTIEDCTSLLRVLARSATGQDFSVYTTFSTGARRPGDLDGPDEYHVVLVDNGRSAMLGTDFQEMLRCIRCAACMNHCPVYGAVGGHAYGWVYPGPMGSVLTPSLIGVNQAGHLPNASTFCGKCESVCPVKIPLPKLMRHWREREFERHLTPPVMRTNLALWGYFARRPSMYRLATRAAAWTLGLLGRKHGRFHKLPFAAGWTRWPRPSCPRRRHLLRPLRSRATRRTHPMSRDAMLAAIRRGLRRGPLPADQAAMLRGRLASHPRHLIPARSRQPHAGQIALFVANVEKEFGSVARVPHLEAVPDAVATYLAAQNLPTDIVMAPHPDLQSIPWDTRPLLHLREGRAEASDMVSLQHAFAGIAETGTLMLPSAPQRPTTLNLLADTEIVLLRASRLVGAYEEAWDLLRAEHDGMPRNVMLVTGPSRSADIEQTLELGAHGPRRLHVVLVDDAAP